MGKIIHKCVSCVYHQHDFWLGYVCQKPNCIPMKLSVEEIFKGCDYFENKFAEITTAIVED
jgi:hypothetical protein